MTVDSPGSLAGFFLEWVRQVRPVEVNVDDVSRFGVVTGDLLEIGLGSLASMIRIGFLSALHQAIKLELLQVVALGSLLRVHRGVLDRRQDHVVFFLSVGKFDLG